MMGIQWVTGGTGLRRVLGAVVAVVALASCSGSSGVGKGNEPKYLVINALNSAQGAPTYTMFECFRSRLQAVMYFTDGSAGDFTNRVKWSSSLPGTVSVSNGDQPAPNGFYANGTLTPGSAGQAIVTADYDGITTNLKVFVDTPQSITIGRVIQGNVVIPANNAFRMGAGTLESLTVMATLNGLEQNVGSSGPTWSFEIPNDGEAKIDPASGTITGVSAGGAMNAQVGFDSCPYTATTSVTVADIQSISQSAEFGSDPLIVGNTEKVNVYADFGNGPEQDISTQATLTSSDPTTVIFGIKGGVSNIASALQESAPVTVSASLPQVGSQLITTDLSVRTLAATLEEIAITPRAASLPAGTTDTANFTATGTYNDGSITQDITRVVTWSVSDSTVASISNRPQTAGQASSVNINKGGAVVVTATDATATITPVDTAELVVSAPGAQ